MKLKEKLREIIKEGIEAFIWEDGTILVEDATDRIVEDITSTYTPAILEELKMEERSVIEELNRFGIGYKNGYNHAVGELNERITTLQEEL